MPLYKIPANNPEIPEYYSPYLILNWELNEIRSVTNFLIRVNGPFTPSHPPSDRDELGLKRHCECHYTTKRKQNYEFYSNLSHFLLLLFFFCYHFFLLSPSMQMNTELELKQHRECHYASQRPLKLILSFAIILKFAPLITPISSGVPKLLRERHFYSQ